MALIRCPECGKEISDKAKACIYCGYPIEELYAGVDMNSGSDDINRQKIDNYSACADDFRIKGKYDEALEFYLKAANLGSAYAQMWIGNIYARGLGVEIDNIEAVKWYKKAAEQDNSEALCNLALMYKKGEGVDKDLKKAIELNLRAIAKGCAVSAGNLGSLYYFGPEDIQSYELARKYYEKAIALGTGEYSVYSNLALIYDEGQGTHRNIIKAEYHYIKAIELGSKMAKDNYGCFANNLALEFAKQENASTNPSKAEEYYLKAIKLGNEQAKINYGIWANNRGVAYADGKGVQRSYASAEQYYLLAIKYGNQRAESNYELLKKQKRKYDYIEKMQEKEEWRQRLTRTCPRCGRHTGHPIGDFEKKMSISFWGFASDKWGKSYKCDYCDYKW